MLQFVHMVSEWRNLVHKQVMSVLILFHKFFSLMSLFFYVQFYWCQSNLNRVVQFWESLWNGELKRFWHIQMLVNNSFNVSLSNSAQTSLTTPPLCVWPTCSPIRTSMRAHWGWPTWLPPNLRPWAASAQNVKTHALPQGKMGLFW